MWKLIRYTQDFKGIKMAKQEMKDLKVAQEDWMVKKWRPAMGWTYMATCIFDFILGPILFNLLQFWNPGQAVGMWTPLTLQGGGMYHIAMGAILGISAWSRGQEKISGVADPKPEAPVMISQPAPVVEQSYSVPTPAPVAPVVNVPTPPVVEDVPTAPLNTSGKPTRKKPNF